MLFLEIYPAYRYPDASDEQISLDWCHQPGAEYHLRTLVQETI